jgi:hypothetical protein
MLEIPMSDPLVYSQTTVQLRRTYLTIFKLADHALLKIVWYVLLRPLRPELDGRLSSANFSYSFLLFAVANDFEKR